MSIAAASLLPDVLALARRAGAAVDAVYATDFTVSTKQDHSPLTQADTAAHEIIAQGLAALGEWPVLSEEAALAPWPTRRAWPVYWLIDPLDGSKEFIARNGEFTVNIALIAEGCPLLGVVYAPALRRAYFAARGAGAFRQDDGCVPVRLQAGARAAGKPWRVVGSRSHGSGRMVDFLHHLGAAELVPMGSSLKICLVAEGAADLYPRLAPTSEWDTAAAQCVLEQAGGSLVCDALRPLRYNSKDSLLNPSFIACRTRSSEWESFFGAGSGADDIVP